MAFMNQEIKKRIVAQIKQQLPGLKFTAKVEHCSTIIISVNIKKNDAFYDQAPHSVNEYYYQNHNYSDGQKKVIAELIDAIKKGGDWYDNSDAMTDYFDTAFYFRINLT